MRKLWWVLVGGIGLVAAGCSGAAPQPPADEVSTASPQQADPSPRGQVIAENARPGDRSWLQAVRGSDPQAVAGYADRSSALPGDPVRLFVSTTAPRYRVTAYRMGWYGGDRARRAWRSSWQPGVAQTRTGFIESTATPYARWRPTTTIDTTGWTPGMYLVRLTASTGGENLIPLVVRSPDVTGRLVFLMADLTWQAYNMWGGRSAYDGPGGREGRSRAVSFARPYANGSGTGKYLGFENPVVALAERTGVPVAYVATTDLADGDADLLAGAEGIVSLGHNEYWTVAQREAVTAARDAGTDLAFLGANTMYWRVRVEPGPQDLPLEVIYKEPADPVQGRETTVRFRDAPEAEPERSLVGMDYECYPATGTYRAVDPGFFLFRGLPVRRPLAGLVGVEVDRAYPLPGTPRTLQIVADNPTDCAGVPTVSTSTYYTTASGAGVFATGSMAWVLRGLRGAVPADSRRFATGVTERLLAQMAAGRMGAAHPSQPNLGDFDLGTTNTTGTVVPPLTGGGAVDLKTDAD